MIRLKNSTTGRVVEYAEPEDIAPPNAPYSSAGAKARADREASRRRRLLDTLRKSKRWSPTTEDATPVSDRQARADWEERERRRIEARLRAEYEQRLENERAKLTTRVSTPEPPGPASATEQTHTTPEPTAAQVRAWAKEAGYEVPARGKLPDEVVDAYKNTTEA